MKNPHMAQILGALLRALEQIGTDDSWCTSPATVTRAVDAAAAQELARPAIVVLEPTWDDFRVETAGSLEDGVANLSIEIILCAGTDGVASNIADELWGMVEDCVRAIRADVSLSLDDPDAPTLSQYVLPSAFHLEQEASIEMGYLSGTLTLQGRLDFNRPATGG